MQPPQGTQGHCAHHFVRHLRFIIQRGFSSTDGVFVCAYVDTIDIHRPWNYPVVLTFQPLIGAIAAGCCAVIKPSEAVPHVSQLIADLLPKYLDTSAYRVVNGAVQVATKLLEFQWDHIFYTGNSRVARIIASAAAKYLTPLSLELGGKSPVLVDSAYDMDLAAKRILWGKCNNAGQVRPRACVVYLLLFFVFWSIVMCQWDSTY